MRKIILLSIAIVVILVGLLALKCKEMKKIKVGDKVPEFSLVNQNGKLVTINSTMGKPLVIYFYPKDDTPGCTKEACSFRDSYTKFSDLGVLVFGISADEVKSHKEFQQKYNLPFTLLADTKNEVRKLFGVPKNLLLIPGRVTYIVDKNGIIQEIFNSQFNAEKHIEIALTKLNEMQ